MLRYTTLKQQLQLQLHYFTLHYTTLHLTLDYTAAHYATLHYTLCTIPQLQLHYTNLHYNYNYNFTTLQLQLQLLYTTLHPAAVGEVTTATIANNHLSVHQWIRSAIHASQQLTSPIVSYLWNFRHRLARYYWYGMVWYGM